MTERAYSTAAYFSLLATAAAGIARAEWWAAMAGTSVLVIVSILRREALTDRWKIQSRSIAAPIVFVATLLNAAAASSAAYALGLSSSWLWGL